MERGILVHVALEAFWRELHDDAGLRAALADPARLAAFCDAAAREALAGVKPERWRRIPGAVRAGEGGRLARMLARWAATAEAGRMPFAVVAREAKLPLALGPLALSLRLDRVDAIEGGVAIVDYKTGDVPSLKAWLDARPKAAQLALYALAWREAHPEQPVLATVVAQVRAGDTGFAGYCADAPISADGKRQVVPRDWNAFARQRDEAMVGLAEAFARGDAVVAPRDRQECRVCGRQALCRIGDADAAGGA
jgi:RecB family exonuclease